MKLRDIVIAILDDSPYQLEFNKECWCVSKMYWYNLRDFESGKFHRLVVSLIKTNNTKEVIDNDTDIIIIDKYFNFKKYFSKGNFERKKIILDTLHAGIMKIVLHQD